MTPIADVLRIKKWIWTASFSCCDFQKNRKKKWSQSEKAFTLFTGEGLENVLTHSYKSSSTLSNGSRTHRIPIRVCNNTPEWSTKSDDYLNVGPIQYLIKSINKNQIGRLKVLLLQSIISFICDILSFLKIKVFDTVFQRPYRYFSNRLKSHFVIARRPITIKKFSPLADFRLRFVKL